MKTVYKYVIVGVVAIGLFAGGYLSGRYITPPNTIVTEKVKEVEKQVVVTQTKTEIKVVTIKEKTKKVTTHEQTVTKPDGTVVASKDTVEDEHVDTHSGTSVDSLNNTVAVKEVVKEVEKTKVVFRNNQWLVGASLNYNLVSGYQNGFLNKASIDHAASVVLSANRKILGPLYVGGWASARNTANPDLQVGLSVSVNWGF
jgi:hypothetical protein